jgi:NADPH:quinone reductase-like Zn-dependent oxidoreductase
MRAVLLRETGDADVLRLEEVEQPEPGEGEVLIRVRAASINPIDWKYRRGIMPKALPAVLGNDVSGTVERSRAEGFAEGEDVFGIAPSGGYAEFATAPAPLLAKKPAGVSHEQAAAIPVGGLTAWQALFDRGGLERGQTALVAGAAGGVGHFAVQFAKRAGARVIGTGSSRNRDFVLGLGAEEYIDYTRQDVAESLSGVDLAFDTVGGETTQSLIAVVREGGRADHDRRRRARAGGGRARGARRIARHEPQLRAAGADRRAGRCRAGSRGDRREPSPRGGAGGARAQ